MPPKKKPGRPRKAKADRLTNIMVAIPSPSRAELDHLIQLVSAEMGMPVPANRTLALAIREALKSRGFEKPLELLPAGLRQPDGHEDSLGCSRL